MSVAILAGTALSMVGCSGEGDAAGPAVTLRVTRDFGRQLLSEETVPLSANATPAGLLRETHDVRVTRYGNIVAVDGLRDSLTPGDFHGNERVWEVNVNGVEIDTRHDFLPLVRGDVVHVDLGDLDGSFDSRATVGAFPQPFSGGLLGRRFRTRVTCAHGYGSACAQVRRALADAGAHVESPPPAQPRVGRRVERARHTQPVILRGHVLVGSWQELRDRPWPHLADEGPRNSGFPARFAADGRSGRLLDWNRRTARPFGPGTGFVIAMCPTERDIVWLVTGTDRRGLMRAVAALDETTLRGAFQVAVTPRGVVQLPLPPR